MRSKRRLTPASPLVPGRRIVGSQLAAIKDRSAERQILSIYDDRIQTQQQLAAVYGKWAAQVKCSTASCCI